MKNLLSIIMFFILISNVSAETTLRKTFELVPDDMQGVWYSLASSTDEGTTIKDEEKPLFSVTSTMISSSYISYVVERVELYSFDTGPGYAFHIQNSNIKFIVVYPFSSPYHPVLYGYKGKKEFIRAVLQMRQF